MKTIPEFTFKGELLKKENMELMASLFLNKSKERHLDKSEISDEFLAQIILKRIEVYSLKFTITDFFFIMCLSTFAVNPGKIMILLRLCYQYWLQTKKELLGIEDFGNMFPWGTPSEEELKEMWDSQKYYERKTGSDNLLDYVENWS